MFNATDDDDFFTPTSSSASNLASLFSGPPHIDAAASLIYTAPKQPPKDQTDGKAKAKTNVKTICVKTVHLFKLVDASYTPQGKHGIAIIGDTDLNVYDLLLYKTRTNITASIKINQALVYTHNRSHSSFKDPQLNFWRVHFENPKDDSEFLAMLHSKGVSVVKEEDEEEEAVKGGEQEGALSDGSQARANILERISKVGQSMLPTVKNPDLSESEQEEIVKTKKVVRKPKRHSTSDKDSLHSTTDIPEQNVPPQFIVPVAPTPMQQQYMLGGQYMPQNQMVPCQMMAINDPLAVHFSEHRTHNSEVRMNLSQLSNKLDTVLNELNCLRVNVPPQIPTPSETSILHSKIAELERKLSNLTAGGDVERLSAEVETYKSEEIVLKQRIEELSGELEHRVRSECEKDAIISEQKSTIKDLQTLTQELELNKETINNLKTNVENLKRTVELQAQEVATKHTLASECESLKATIEQQRAEMKSQQQQLEQLDESRQDSVKVFAEVIKETMNGMYQNILERCGGDDSDFKKILSQHMKTTTFQIIQDYKKNVMDTRVRSSDDLNPPPVPEFEVTV